MEKLSCKLCLFPEIMTRFLKIIHRPCCKQFHLGTIFFLLNYSHQPYHCTEGSVHLFMDETLCLFDIHEHIRQTGFFQLEFLILQASSVIKACSILFYGGSVCNSTDLSDRCLHPTPEYEHSDSCMFQQPSPTNIRFTSDCIRCFCEEFLD